MNIKNVLEEAQNQYWQDVYTAAKEYNEGKEKAVILAVTYEVLYRDLLNAARKLRQQVER